MNDTNQAALIDDFRKGDVNALDQIVVRYQREICHFAAQIVKDRETAEEIVDDCFLKTWNARHRFATLADIKSYLYVVARNACLDFIKSPRNRKPEHLDELHFAVASEENIEAQLIYSELLGAIYDEVTRLPEKQRLVFQMSYFDGLSTKEIAERLGISQNAVSINKHEATKTIRHIFRAKNPLMYLLFIQHFYASFPKDLDFF